MSERKDFPPVTVVKAESRRPVSGAPAANPQARPAAPAPARLPAAGGHGHVMRPAPAPQPVAARPAVPPQQPMPRPVPVASAAVAPAAAPARPVAPAPQASARKPEKPAVDPAAFLNLPWFKGLTAPPLWAGYRRFAALGSDSMQASMQAGVQAGAQAGAVFVRGFDRLAQVLVTLASEQMAEGVAAAEEIGSCRSFEAVLATQSALAQASFIRLSTAADRLSQMSVALAEEICEPVTDEIDAATDRFIETLAR